MTKLKCKPTEADAPTRDGRIFASNDEVVEICCAKGGKAQHL
jgi:hypothetical protein